jgi:hypothetical protein
MEIINESDVDAAWFCYNSNDTLRAIPLTEGNVGANGGRASYNPPNNATGAYQVLLTATGSLTMFIHSGKFGVGVAKRDGTVRLKGSCAYEVVRGAQRAGGPIEIVNQSDMDVTWWCFNSNDWMHEIPLEGGKQDLKKGGRVSYSPPGNATGA